jgi:hypothetical protein
MARRKSKSKLPLYAYVLYNTYVLYGLFFLAILNVLKLLHYNQLKAISVFFITGALFSFFTRNMIVIMGASIAASSLFCMSESMLKKRSSSSIQGYSGSLWGSVYEGMENETEAEEEAEAEEEVEAEEEAEAEKEPLQEGARGGIRPKALQDNVDHAYVDKASTIENSYSQISDLLGEDAMKNLSNETAKLVKQQQQLIETMKGAGPVIENMKSMMNGLNTDDMKSMQENVSGLMSNMKKKK